MSRSRPAAPFVVLLALGAAACGPPPAVRFGEPSRPFTAAEYATVQGRWTRHSRITTSELALALDAQVTLLSPEFRAAYVAKVATMRQLTDSQIVELVQEQKRDGERFVDFVVLFQSARWEWNDLSSPRSSWTLTAIDDQGHQLGPGDIQAPTVRAAQLAELFPGVTPFTRAYRVRFPRTPATLLDEKTGFIRLRIAGPLGRTVLAWDAAR